MTRRSRVHTSTKSRTRLEPDAAQGSVRGRRSLPRCCMSPEQSNSRITVFNSTLCPRPLPPSLTSQQIRQASEHVRPAPCTMPTSAPPHAPQPGRGPSHLERRDSLPPHLLGMGIERRSKREVAGHCTWNGLEGGEFIDTVTREPKLWWVPVN